MSRETFLENERLKRLREARNFVFDGDENAPTLTRSGRVVSRKDGPDIEEQAYGEAVGEAPSSGDGDVLEDLPVETMVPTDVKGKQPVRRAIAHSARVSLLHMLGTLTGRADLPRPPPFPQEETNETLRGLVNLLQGTVERGEGNSALVVGPRGSGKSRVSAAEWSQGVSLDMC